MTGFSRLGKIDDMKLFGGIGAKIGYEIMGGLHCIYEICDFRNRNINRNKRGGNNTNSEMIR